MPDRLNRLENPTVRKLLEAAEQVFAENGFAGARIDDIAARAGMAKSHVYYHFDSKQQIFDDLISLRIGEILEQKTALMEGLTQLDRPAIATLAGRALRELLVPRAAFIRIVLLESVGTGDSDLGAEPLLLRVLRPLLEDTVSRYEALGYDIDRDVFISDVFHFGLLPIVMHIALGERWAAASGIEPSKADELFVSRLVDLQVWNIEHLRQARRDDV
ncbi:MAG: helix-turn-helix domain containing protein [Coriobacteriia bacterium]|nr:helix-turn-helix domain containing protein [Coriobacteriia bacterium]